MMEGTVAEPLDSVPKIRVVFMGTPDFAKELLNGLLDAGYNVVAAYTRPDKPVGRHREMIPSPVKALALQQNIPVEQPVRFDEITIASLKSYRPDIIVVAAYGRILPQTVLSLPGFGCLNVHASLLPRWRGASPVQNALLSGDSETGVSIMLMDAGMDTGPLFAQKAFPIASDDTYTTLLSRMSTDGVTLLREVIPQWIERRIEPIDQDDSKATLCELIEREDGRILWNDSAENILNQYRGLSPWPGIFTFWKRNDGLIRLKLTKISIQKTDPVAERKYGEVFEAGEKIAVRCGLGIVFLEELQPEGKGRMSTRDFINGKPEFIGSVLS
ncbi:MAG: methionyl-tRNA formyltransferase [Candidatus Moranbacteria bacterium]|nr:methionyl-tRNA formyltransferase [Candidatus Moranbacteria bacterium]